jgi:hypothetical protein
MNEIKPQTLRPFLIRLASTAVAAAAFLLVCWMFAGSVNGDIRLIAGPVGFFRTQSITDKVVGAVPISILLPCIFTVGVWPNAAAITLAIFGLMFWIALGIWIEGTAAC